MLICKNCAYPLDDDWKYCPKCNASAETGLVEVIREQHKEPAQENDGSNTYIAVFLVSFVLGVVTSLLGISYVGGLFSLVSLITIVTAKIKYPKNATIKVIFWVYIGLTVFSIIAFAILLAACFSSLNSCSR